MKIVEKIKQHINYDQNSMFILFKLASDKI